MLRVPHPAIERGRREQRVVRPNRGNATAIQHDDLRRRPQRRQPMRDDERRPPCISRASALCTRASASESRLDVASSRSSSGAFLRMARAMLIRWIWPPESPRWPVPTTVAYLFGRARISWWISAACAAASTSSSEASGRPQRMFSRTVVENRIHPTRSPASGRGPESFLPGAAYKSLLVPCALCLVPWALGLGPWPSGLVSEALAKSQ